MKNEKTRVEYKNELKELRKYYNFSFDARNKLTPQRKAAITRAKNRYESTVKKFQQNGGQFIKTTRTEKRRLKESRGEEFATPKGYFVFPPKGTDKTTYDLKTDAIIYEVGDAIFKTYPLKDPVAFAENPDRVLRSLPEYRKADLIRVNVGEGMHASNQAYVPEQMNQYITKDIPGDPVPAYPSRNTHNPADFITGITLVFEK